MLIIQFGIHSLITAANSLAPDFRSRLNARPSVFQSGISLLPRATGTYRYRHKLPAIGLLMVLYKYVLTDDLWEQQHSESLISATFAIAKQDPDILRPLNVPPVFLQLLY